eukprot:jgi/Mesvir1/15202/Mv06436-RA.2
MHKNAFRHAFKEVYDMPHAHIDMVSHHGLTDKLVIQNTMKHLGLSHEAIWQKMPQAVAKMVEYSQAHPTNGEGLEVLPGVETLLRALASRGDVLVGLVTGNLVEIAWLKMRALGLEGLFTEPKFGGFGSDHTERSELVRIARGAAEQILRQRSAHDSPVPCIGAHWHVGDTPNDMKAAVIGEARALGVLTGVFTEAELLEALGSGRGAILNDLSELEAVMKVFGLSL